MKNQQDNLEQTFNEVTGQLLQLLTSLTEEQLNRFLIPGKWTPGQLGLHLYKSYASVYILQGNSKPASRPIDQKIPLIKSVLLNFDKSYQAPREVVVDANESVQKERLLKGLQKRITKYKEIMQHQDLSAICTDFAIPQYGEFTRLEWLWFDTYHTMRHVEQLKKLVYDPTGS